MQSVGEALYEAGFTDIISVIPPGAQLAPSSKINPEQTGKTPGVRVSSGLWVGYNWRRDVATIDDVRKWERAGANLGLRTDRFPAVDIDCTDERLSSRIADIAMLYLGDAPVRIGAAPKQLLVYRTAEPFGRMRLRIHTPDRTHLVEILGAGQQCLIHGIHPGTGRPYEWPDAGEQHPLVAAGVEGLSPITREQANAFLTYLTTWVETQGVGTAEREGTGDLVVRVTSEDGSLEAPSLDALREAMALIPNDNDTFPDRDDYIRMAYALRAAAGEANEREGFALWTAWAAKWEGNDKRDGNDPDIVRDDWLRVKGPFAIGWPWIAEHARRYGFNDAALSFDDDLVAEAPSQVAAVLHSEQWLADQVAAALRGRLRYVPQTGQFLAWDGGRWRIDDGLLAEDLVKHELRRLADRVARTGATPAEKRRALETATAFCSASKASNVRALLKSDRTIAVSADALDHDLWELNTPRGWVDLRTGKVHAPDPDRLHTRSTSVAPDFSGAMPEWRRFLAEATGGDRELEAYLQRLAGYTLTGSTREEHLTFVWGPAGTGKSKFLNALYEVLGDYAVEAPMSMFTASNTDRHTTDLAMLRGARLVAASETQAGRRWDEARLKLLTGRDPITARFVHKDNFVFIPQFKLVFTGNHRPELRDSTGMERRLHLVPFTVKPAVPDPNLPDKLREEAPAILAWMIEGALRWQRLGLAPPAIVLATTEEYFEAEDAVGRWLAEMTEEGEGELSEDLYASWREWANRNGEWPGGIRTLSGSLASRGLPRWRHPINRRRGFGGIKLISVWAQEGA